MSKAKAPVNRAPVKNDTKKVVAADFLTPDELTELKVLN